MKRQKANTFLLVTLLIAPSALRSQSRTGVMPAEEIFKRFSSRVLFLTCDESPQQSLLASGVLVSSDGLIATNGHVVAPCQSTITATQISGKVRKSYDATLRYYDEPTDVAILKIEGQGFDFFNLLAEQPQIGERVYAIGNPRGYEQSITEGIVSGNRELNGISWIQHSAPISPGSSGGALISSHGMLLGINSRFSEDSQNLNFAVPAATLSIALQKARTTVQTGRILELKIGLSYVTGEGVPKDDIKAATWIRRAAEQGDAEAQTTLGVLYSDGRGVPLSDEEAAKWFLKAAGQGYPRAKLALGRLYLTGRGVQKDDTKAAIWIHQAAEQGLASAEYNIGVLYEEGQGVARDYAQATAWYRKAAEQGWTVAQIALGVDYQLGHGVPKDDSEAVSWFLKASERGDARAYWLLYAAWLKGVGVPQSYAEAYFWLKLASESRIVEFPNDTPETASQQLGEIQKHLSVVELSSVQKRVREWLAIHPAKGK